MNDIIPVTKPFLPPIEEYQQFVQEIWDRNWLTNDGPLLRKLEGELQQYLNLPEVILTGNGTIALQIAIKALDITGEVITTPFSYVATTASIVWQNCTPVFVDIDPQSLNIAPSAIEAAITPRTQAILATHVFGNPCDVEAIELIARKHQLKVIYDAAHCFGVKYKGRSIFSYGDISVASFHATKLYHMVEGGGLFSADPYLRKKLKYMRNFGHAGFDVFAGVGINGKNSELHAAMGLCNLKYIEQIIAKRKQLSEEYDRELVHCKLTRQILNQGTDYNFAYYPVLIEDEHTLIGLIDYLKRFEISPRRYFYPSLDTLNYVNSSAHTNSADIAARSLCIPLFYDLSIEDVLFVSKRIIKYLDMSR